MFRDIKMQDPTNPAFTMNMIVKNTKTKLFSGRNELKVNVSYIIFSEIYLVSGRNIYFLMNNYYLKYTCVI